MPIFLSAGGEENFNKISGVHLDFPLVNNYLKLLE